MFTDNTNITRRLTIDHQEEQMRRADRERLVQEALADRRVSFYQPFMLQLGKRMVRFGNRIQDQYTECVSEWTSSETESPASHAYATRK